VAKIPKKKWYEAGDALAGLYADSVEWLDKSSAAVRAEAQKARMQRAVEQDFDLITTKYHGSPNISEFDEFDPAMTGRGNDQFGPGFYLSNSPNQASGYASDRGRTALNQPLPAPGVIPTNTKTSNLMEVDGTKANNLGDAITLNRKQIRGMLDQSGALKRPLDSEDMNPLGDFYESFWDDGPEEWMLDDLASKYEGRNPEEIVELFDDQTEFLSALSNATGFDGLKINFRNELVNEVHWKPENIRSVNAQFDPAKRKSSKLLASSTGAAALVGMGAALSGQPAEAGMIGGAIQGTNNLIRLGFLKAESALDAKSVKGAQTRYENQIAANPEFRRREALALANQRKDDVVRADLGPRKIITPEDMQGKALVSVPGDRSDISTINSVRGIELPKPVEVEGGAGFSQRFGGWASEYSIAAKKQRALKNAADDSGRDVIGVYSGMGENSINYSTPIAEIMMSQIAGGRIPKKDKLMFDEEMRRAYPQWVGLDDPRAMSQLMGESIEGLAALPGKARTPFTTIMGKSEYRKLGFPSYNDAVDVATNPDLKNINIGDSGYSMFKANPSEPVQYFDGHKTYNTEIPGEYFGGLEESVPNSVMFPDAYAQQRSRINAAGVPFPHGQAMNAIATRGDVYQKADQQWLDGIKTYIEKNPAKQGYNLSAIPERGNANPLLLGGIAATTAAGLALSGEAEAGVGKGIKSALRVFDTEDGYRFFELSDGTLVDNLDPDAVDMAFDNIKQLKDEMGDGVFQIGDELAKARYSKNNVDISELNQKYYKDMDSSPQKGNANPLLLGGVAATTAAGLALSGEAEAGPVNIIDPITGLIRKGIEAYHGSPHKFDPSVRVRNKKTGKEHILAKNSWDNPNSPYKGTGHPLDPDLREEFEVLSDNPLGAFSMDNIGTGEGAQAYGHGLYFADSEGVARGYREQLTRDNVPELEVPFIESMEAVGVDLGNVGGEALYEFVTQYAHNKGDLSGTISDARRTSKLLKSDGQDAAELDAVIEAVDKARVNGFEPPIPSEGALYRTELDVDPDTLLDWDKPLSEQSESVRDAVDRVIAKHPAKSDYWLNKPSLADKDYWTGEHIYYALGKDAKAAGVGTDASRTVNAPQRRAWSSNELLQEGIPGIRYLDGDSRNRPAIDIQNEFLNELPEDASIEEVVEMLGTGQFSPKNEELISALDDDNWLGFDFPAQAISVALGRNASNYDVSPRLTQAVKNAQVDNPTSNYVMFDDSKISIKERGMATPAALAATAVAGGAGIGPALNLSDIAVGGAETSALQPLADQEYIDEAPVREMEGATGALIMELLQETQRSSQEFSMQHAAKAELRAARKAEVLRATGVAVNIAKGVVAAPWKGLAGINALGTSLFAGTGLDEAINIAGNTAQMSNDQAVDQGFAFLDKPMQGYQGMASVASGLVTGEGIQGALNAGADTANRSVDENARLYGDIVYEGMDQYDATRPLAPAFGALTYGGMLVGAPF